MSGMSLPFMLMLNAHAHAKRDACTPKRSTGRLCMRVAQKVESDSEMSLCVCVCAETNAKKKVLQIDLLMGRHYQMECESGENAMKSYNGHIQ